MTTSVLVVTPHPSFGELIRQSLEETGEYKVHIVSEYADAVAWLKRTQSSLALLDMDLKQVSVKELGLDLRRINPEIKLVVISSAPNPPAYDEIRPWVLLRKPFYLPELLGLLEMRAAEDTTTDSVQQKEVNHEGEHPMNANEPAWMHDVSRAAQHLTRLTLESSAQAAMIARAGELWAYSGQLSQAAAQEIIQSLTRGTWTGDSDLLRFIRLQATKAEHMLYATQLSSQMILAMVFDAETPFSTIRTQANQLSHSLIATQYETGPVVLDREELAQNTAEMMDAADDIPSIAAILADVPPPLPMVTVQPAARNKSRRQVSVEQNPPVQLPFENQPFSREASPAIPLGRMVDSEQATKAPRMKVPAIEVEDIESKLAETRKSTVDLDATLRTDIADQSRIVNPVTETRPQSVTEVARRIVLEPVSPAMYNLTYACLLVPRFATHYLTGDLADYLSNWMQELSIAYGWRLEFLSVRPEYLQWVVNVPPATSPGYLMRIIRTQTSEKMFREFGRLKRENPSGDFWAPGYLIMGGAQPHPQQLIKDYIKQTRQRQGISGTRY